MRKRMVERKSRDGWDPQTPRERKTRPPGVRFLTPVLQRRTRDAEGDTVGEDAGAARGGEGGAATASGAAQLPRFRPGTRFCTVHAHMYAVCDLACVRRVHRRTCVLRTCAMHITHARDMCT